MDTKFHKIAPIIALRCMPKAFRDFLITMGEFPEKRISEIATYPDLLDHDNIRQNAEIHHAHSYKLEMVDKGAFKWLDGDCIKTIESLCAFTLDAWREYQKVDQWPLIWLVRYALAKVSHYRIDALTYPHLHRGKPWSEHHTSFEKHMDKWIVRYQDDLGDFQFQPYAHVYNGCRQTAIEAWGRGLDLILLLEAGEKLKYQDCLMASRCCIQGVGDLWLTLSIQMGLE